MTRNGVCSLVLLAALFLSACEASNPFTTAGSLRVEVEVYKGPLSREPSIQWAEFVGLVKQAHESLIAVSDGARRTLELDNAWKSDDGTLMKDVLYEGSEAASNGVWYDIEKGCGSARESTINEEMCLSRELLSELQDIIGDAGEMPNDPDKIRRILRQSSGVALQLKAKAFLAAESQASFAFGNLFSEGDRRYRIAITNFSVWAAEYGNQIGSRADALLKQMQIVPADRRELPLSVYLRDTEPTDFPSLRVWNRAAAPAIWEEMLLHPIDALSSEETTDRVRVVETLFGDHNWSHINTVYASGQGETSIARIKDDIGNWNLKSFDTDPTELLDAYKKLTLAGIKTATTVVEAGLSGGSTAAFQSALDTASKLTQGQIAPGGGGSDSLNVDKLHERVEARIAAAGQEAPADEGNGEETDVQKAARERTVRQLEAILAAHEDVIGVLEESVAISNTP